MKIFITFLVSILIGTSCLSQSFSTLAVFISDSETGKPVSSASVIVKEAGWASKTTGIDGKAFFDKSMPVGEIHYIVSKEGFQGIEGTFNITTEEKSNSLNIKLSKFRDDRLLITGEVVDEEDRDLEGATVEVKVADIVKTAKTDAAGNYKIELTLNKTAYDVNMIKLEAKCSNGTGKKTETIDLTRRNVIYKDFKINCGKVIKPPPTPKYPKLTIDDLTFELIDCKQLGQTVRCEFIVTSDAKDVDLGIPVNVGTGRIIDGETGYEYNPKRVSIGNKAADSGHASGVNGTIIAGYPTKIIAEFKDVIAPISIISKLEIEIVQSISGGPLSRDKIAFKSIKVTK